MARPLVGIAGFQHETNSFSPVRANLAAFIEPTNWPGMTEGVTILTEFPSFNLPTGGFILQARQDFDLIPTVWANATPSGPLTEEAFETIAGRIVSGLSSAARLDGVYLDLHGAMIAEGVLDGEAELLRRLRHALGEQVPVVVSLDLHANISAEMIELADALVVCRTYPHVDLADTGRRSARVLAELLAKQQKPFRKLWKADFLIPIQAQTTLCEPAAGLYAELEQIEAELDLVDLSMAMGFGPSDTPAGGPSICATAFDESIAFEAVRRLSERFTLAAPRFFQAALSPNEAVQRALAQSVPGKPVVLADLQDNPGAGGTGDTTGLLSALAEARVKDCLLAVLYDPQAAAAAHLAGIGRTLSLDLGGRVGGPGSVPFRSEVTVEALGSGQFVGTGPMYGGGPMNFGPMALLRLSAGPAVAVGSVNTQAADLSILDHLGVVPGTLRIIALKSAVHFRAAFGPISSQIILVESPGANAADYRVLSFKYLRPGVAPSPE